MASEFAGLIAVMAIMVLFFLIARAIVLWYWRVNEGIALLKSIDEKLGNLTNSAVAVTPLVKAVPVVRASGTR